MSKINLFVGDMFYYKDDAAAHIITAIGKKVTIKYPYDGRTDDYEYHTIARLTKDRDWRCVPKLRIELPEGLFEI